MSINTLSNQQRIIKLQASNNDSKRFLSDQNMAKFGTNRKSEIVAKIGNTGVPFEQQYNDYVNSL